MKLNLPTDPKERNAIITLAVIIAIVIVFCLVRFAIIPFMDAKRSKLDRLAELEDLLWQADRDINIMEGNQRKNVNTIREILHISEEKKYVLQPSLGNYLLVAEDQIKDWATKAGVKFTNIRQLSPPPTSKQDLNGTEPVLAPYAVAIQLKEGLHLLVQFIHLIQKENPYVTITSIAISSTPGSETGEHNVSMTIEWPIWKDPSYPNQLSAELLADEAQP
jgi:hypothetical protein